MPFDLELPDGTVLRDVPDGTTKAQIAARLKGAHGIGEQPQADPPQLEAEPQPYGRQPVERRGFAAQVRRTLGGDRAQPVPVPTGAELARDYGQIARGAAVGVPSGALGLPGDMEALARLPLSLAGVSRETALPTSTDVGNFIAGPAQSKYEEAGRVAGSMAGPSLAIKGTKLAAKGLGTIGKETLGFTTGAGSAAIEEAYKAGKAGGTAGAAFLDNMRRGTAASDDAVRLAKDAVEEMGRERSLAYRAGISGTIKGDPTVLNFAPIDQAIRNVSGVGVYQGKSLSGSADKVWKSIENVVDEWRQANPAVFHTPEGLDALKKKIGNLAFEEELKTITGPRSPGAAIVNGVYSAIKNQIVQQAPRYAKVMKDYHDATDELREVEKTFSLGKNATADTSLRKLQSILRNNANTNYGQRVQLSEQLSARSPDLMPTLAGQALNSTLPRGLSGQLAGASAGTLAASTMNPAYLMGAALSSPRVVGEGAFALGRASNIGNALLNPLKSAILPGGGASIPRIAGAPPQLIGAALLSQLLAQQPALQP